MLEKEQLNQTFVHQSYWNSIHQNLEEFGECSGLLLRTEAEQEYL